MTQYKSEADRNVHRAFIENCRDMGRDHVVEVRHLGPRGFWWYTKLGFVGLLLVGLMALIGYALLRRTGL